MDSSNLTIDENQSILDALEKLNNIRDVSRLILFITNGREEVIGSLTDGDIRRSLAKDKDLHKKVSEICNKNFAHKNSTDGFIELKSIRKQNIVMLPILNQDKSLHRILDLDKIKSVVPVECVIMAGGRGKRLSPLTDTVPKQMLPLDGKPIIEYNIDKLITFGIKKFYISVKYLGEQIEDYFGDGSSKGISIEYVWEDKPLGTAGSLTLIEKFNTDQVLLMNSDLFTNVNIEEMYLKLINEKADMVIASTEYKINVPYAVFESSNYKVNAFKEKPTYVYHSNAGVYLFDKKLIAKIPKNSYYDITDLMDKLIEENKNLLHNPIRGYWIDIGKPVDYKNAQDFIKHLKE
jgi:dTDP-glucose pyrophosphorylase